MNSPILNQVGSVFIPVSDMPTVIAWYSALLDLPVGRPSHNDAIYNLPMQGETQVILDSHRPVSNSSQPLLFFWTHDIQEAYYFLQQRKIHVLSTVEDIGSVSFLLFKDPDDNLLMVCQANH